MTVKERLQAHRYEKDDRGNPITWLDHFCAPSNMSRSGINSARTGLYALCFIVGMPVVMLLLLIVERLSGR